MDKKFLSAEEAIAQFGLDPAQFQHMVDEGELRALADQKTWKYRRDEIEGLIRDGLLTSQNSPQGSQTLSFDTPVTGAGPDDLAFIEIDEEALAEGATTINKTSDFDFLDSLDTPAEVFEVPDDEAVVQSPPADSVSDVRLVPETGDVFAEEQTQTIRREELDKTDFELGEGTEELPVAASLSEFDLDMTSDAAVDQGESSVIAGAAEEKKLESDSDVKVVTDKTSDSDVVLAGETDSNGILLSENDPELMTDSDVRLADSGISLEAPDSGISLESSSVVSANDSAYLKDDSGISLHAGDSGISLHSAVDSGISLEAGDSGLSLGGFDSGIRLDEQTGRPKRPPRPAETEVEMEQFGSQDFASISDSSGIDQTAMVVLDDDDSSSKATLPPKKGKKSPGISQAFDSSAEVEDLEIVDDLEAGELDVEDGDELIDDVLDASDEVFTTGESGDLSEEGISSVSALPSAISGPREPSWGIAAVLPVAVCALLLALNGLILWEGVSTMWSGTPPAISGGLIDALGG